MEEVSERSLRRIKKSKLNTTVALFTSIIMGVFSFTERTFFNWYFTSDYLGLYSFNKNIIGILSTAELGITAAIAFALYAPIEYKDNDQIIAIMSFLKRAYFVIGSVIIAGGVILSFFFPFLITTDVPMIQVKEYFFIFLTSTAIGYFLNYRNILLSANQEQYKITLWTNISETLLYIAQIVVAVTTQNFLIYSICLVLTTLLKSTILNLIAKREFPFLKSKKKTILDPHIKKQIFRNTVGLVNTKIGQMILNSTDSLLISTMVGTAFLGKYANYQMITEGLLTITRLLPTSITASIGNAGVTESKETLARSFYTLDISAFFIYSSITLVLLNIMNPIVSTFFGDDRTIPRLSVILICINFYITSLREVLLTFKGSLGLYWYDKNRPIIAGVFNLIVSILLGTFWGFDGIIGGTIITNIFINLTIEPRIVFNEGLSRSSNIFYRGTFSRFILFAFIAFITMSINSFLPERGLLIIIVRLIITVIFTIGILFTIYRKNEYARIMIKTLKIAFNDRRFQKSDMM